MRAKAATATGVTAASLPPAIIGEVGLEKMEKLYENGGNNRFTAAASLFNLGDLKRIVQSDQQALKLYKQGHELVKQMDDINRYEEKSIRIALQVAGINRRLKKYPLAVEAMIDHINGLKRVRDGLKSKDPKVLAEFNQLIRQNETLLVKLEEIAVK